MNGWNSRDSLVNILAIVRSSQESRGFSHERFKIPTYSLVNYFDVWGNAKDGWEVNDLCTEKTGITITDDATDKEILNYLVQIGFLTTSDMRKVKIDTSDGDMMEIYAVKGMQPLGRLQREWK